MEKWKISSLIPLFLIIVMGPMSSATPIADADANADPDADPMNIEVNVFQNVGDGSGNPGSLQDMEGSEIEDPNVADFPEEEKVPTTETPTTEVPSCPENFFMSGPSNKCYHYNDDDTRSWEDSNIYCDGLGATLARPENATALAIYLMTYRNFGSETAWLGARADGISFVWQGGERISNSDPLWIYNGGSYPRVWVGSTKCLQIELSGPPRAWNPLQPYASGDCVDSYYVVCELA